MSAFNSNDGIDRLNSSGSSGIDSNSSDSMDGNGNGNSGMNVNGNSGISRIQAIFRANRCRDTHVKRAKEGLSVICPYAKSSNDVVTKMLLLGTCNSNDIVIDLGCGDGSILVAVAVAHGSQCYGIYQYHYHHYHYHYHYH